MSGWKTKGVSSAFSSSLMMECDKYSKLNPNLEPIDFLNKAYAATINNVIGGSSTACVAKLNNSILSIANHGDSGLIVIRNKRVIFRTSSDYISGDCPYQLGKWELDEDFVDPDDHYNDVNKLYNQLGRRTIDTKIYHFRLKDQDIVIMGTDGFFDNMQYDSIIESCDLNDPNKISLSLIKKAITNTLSMNPLNIDDITIVVGIVNIDHNHSTNHSTNDLCCCDDQCKCDYCTNQQEPGKKRHKNDS